MSNTEKKISFLDLLIILAEKKWVFVGGMLFFSVCGVVGSLFMTKYYTATAEIMKPVQKMAPGLSSLVGKDMPMSGLLKSMDLFGSSNVNQFLSILNSRRLAEKTIARFNLAHYYGFDLNKKYFIEDVLRTLQKSIRISENKFDNIEIAVTDTSPTMACAIANFMVEQLDSITFELARESAKSSRLFFAERLGKIKSDLDSASREFSDFQISHNYFSLDQQVKSTIEAIAKLEAWKIEQEMEIEQIKSQFGTNSQRLLELSRNKSVMENRIKYYLDSGGGELMVSLKRAPAAAITYGNLLRNVKIQENLYEFALQMVEQAKFVETNSTPIVQLLDWAKVPQKKTRPKRSMICFFFFMTGFVITSLSILSVKWFEIQKKQNSDAYNKTAHFFSLLFSKK